MSGGFDYHAGANASAFLHTEETLTTKPKRKPTPGTTTPTQFRLSDDVLAALDRIVARHGLLTRTAAVRHLIATAAKRIEGKP